MPAYPQQLGLANTLKAPKKTPAHPTCTSGSHAQPHPHIQLRTPRSHPTPHLPSRRQVPLWKVNLKNMGEVLAQYKGRYTTVVGFQPTGWTHQQQRQPGDIGRRSQRGTLVLYQVSKGAPPPPHKHSRRCVTWGTLVL